jgi:hypothetical protein
MPHTVAEKAQHVATFRFVSVFAMETLARWTPLTPELEIKLLFGRHLWEFAQQADALGYRTAELRAGQHTNRPPVAGYLGALEDFAALETPAERVSVVYDVLIPDLIQRYQAFLSQADPLLDQPTIRLFDRFHRDLARLQEERTEMLSGVALPPAAAGWIGERRTRLRAITEFTSFGTTKGTAA